MGSWGAATAFHLARRGARVAAFDQFEPGHEHGSSHGESRAIRLAYFEHPSYVPLLYAAYDGWRRLERETGRTILTITGILEAGRPGSPIVDGSLYASRLHSLPHEVLDAPEMQHRFPGLRMPPDWRGVFQPDGGFVRPELAIELFIAGAREAGAAIVANTEVLSIESRSSGVAVVTRDQTIEAGSVVVAAGPWIGRLAPLLTPHLTLTEQVLGWFQPIDPAPFALGALPVFILDGEEDTCYGFPDFAGTGVKVASHRPIRRLPAASAKRATAGWEDEARLRRFMDAHLPRAAGPMRDSRACIYTRTPDEDFILDTHPDDPRIVLASPCSGHGFKFAPVLGEILASLALDGASPYDVARFRLARLARAAA